MDSETFQKMICGSLGLELRNFEREAESQDYEACSFSLDEVRVQYRTAKITPTKNGQFVTLWKRVGNGPIQPFDVVDPVDLFVIGVRAKEHFGQFFFSSALLFQKGVLSKEGRGGKRAIRVYPSWDTPESRQAQNTQNWQLPHFLDLSAASPEPSQICRLFNATRAPSS